MHKKPEGLTEWVDLQSRKTLILPLEVTKPRDFLPGVTESWQILSLHLSQRSEGGFEPTTLCIRDEKYNHTAILPIEQLGKIEIIKFHTKKDQGKRGRDFATLALLNLCSRESLSKLMFQRPKWNKIYLMFSGN